MSRYDMNEKLKKGSLSRRDFIKLFGRGAKVGAGITLASALLPERAFAGIGYRILLRETFDTPDPNPNFEYLGNFVGEQGGGKLIFRTPVDSEAIWTSSYYNLPKRFTATLEYQGDYPSGNHYILLGDSLANYAEVDVGTANFSFIDNNGQSPDLIPKNLSPGGLYQLRLEQQSTGMVKGYVRQNGGNFETFDSWETSLVNLESAAYVLGFYAGGPNRYDLTDFLLEERLENVPVLNSLLTKLIIGGGISLLAYKKLLEK